MLDDQSAVCCFVVLLFSCVCVYMYIYIYKYIDALHIYIYMHYIYLNMSGVCMYFEVCIYQVYKNMYILSIGLYIQYIYTAHILQRDRALCSQGKSEHRAKTNNEIFWPSQRYGRGRYSNAANNAPAPNAIYLPYPLYITPAQLAVPIQQRAKTSAVIIGYIRSSYLLSFGCLWSAQPWSAWLPPVRGRCLAAVKSRAHQVSSNTSSSLTTPSYFPTFLTSGDSPIAMIVATPMMYC